MQKSMRTRKEAEMTIGPNDDLKPLTPSAIVAWLLEEARRAGIEDFDWFCVELIDELKRACVCDGLESDRTF